MYHENSHKFLWELCLYVETWRLCLKNELMLPIYLFSDLYESLPKMLDFVSDLTEEKKQN